VLLICIFGIAMAAAAVGMHRTVVCGAGLAGVLSELHVSLGLSVIACR
jgi:hypothetical protein